MELRQIQYFIEVAKREHMTEAAYALHVAQSAISRQIVNLENELGVELFIREGRNVRLTPIGKVFLEHMEKAMNVIDNATQVVEEYMDPLKGTVHIGFPSSLSSYTLPSIISAFRKEYPEVKFQFMQGSYYELVDKVKKGEVNIAFLGPVPQDIKKIEGNILFTERIVALLPKTHRLSSESVLTLNQLRNESFILFPKGFILRDIIFDACRQIGFEPKVSFVGEEIDAIKGLVSAGLGITLIPEVTLVESIPRGTKKVYVEEPTVTRTVGTIISAERQLLPTEKIFYEFVQNYFKRLEQYQY
jgi:LysR family transcriptional regulator, transcription activator of glutamate synthase operon